MTSAPREEGFVDISSVAKLTLWAEQIARLYRVCFDREFDRDFWDWCYIDNPNGSPCVSLLVEDDQLLGHYGVVATRLRCGDSSFVAYRSMTTMVHPRARGRKLMFHLAERTYALMRAAGASLVYGFPNQNSLPVFQKHLGWTLPPPDAVADLSGRQIRENHRLAAALTDRNGIFWDDEDPRQRSWRVDDPRSQAWEKDGAVTKLYDGRLNLLSVSRAGLESLDANTIYRVLVPASLSEELILGHKVFDYQFGYRMFDRPDFHDAFKRELILSDIF